MAKNRIIQIKNFLLRHKKGILCTFVLLVFSLILLYNHIQTQNPSSPDIKTDTAKNPNEAADNEDTDESTLKFSENRIIVQLKNNTSTRAGTPDLKIRYKRSKVLNPTRGRRNRNRFSTENITNTHNNTFVLELDTKGKDAVQDAIEELKKNPNVENAEPDYLYKLSLTPNDPQYFWQYGNKLISAPTAWDITTGENTAVGVIDSGIDYSHPDLQPNFWKNPGEKPVPDGIDNDGNGYVDDIYGYDFVKQTGGYPTDGNGHGTHVAGIIGAKGNNGLGICGVNWNTKIAALKIAYQGDYLSIDGAIEALTYAKNNGITITNNSYGGASYSKIFRDTIKNYGGVFVAAAGNDGLNTDIYKNYPSGFDCDNIISVASTDENDRLSYFSNYGKTTVDIAAPGSNIKSTYTDNTYITMSGTSMASPYVAGVAALLKGRNPNYSTSQIISSVLNGVDIRLDLTGKMQTSGRVNTYYTLEPQMIPNVRLSGVTLSSSGATLQTGQTLQLQAQITPINATDKSVKWSSQNTGVATVSQSGLVTGKSGGTTLITAVTNDGGIASSCKVSIPYTVKALSENNKYGAVKGGGKYTQKQTATVTGIPKSGYRFVRWMENAANVFASSKYSFTVNKNRTVKARFSKIGKPTVKISSLKGRKIKLKWGAVTGAKNYYVYRSTSKNGKYTKISAVSSAGFTNTGLKTNKYYYYKVRARCAAGTVSTFGEYSAVKYAKPSG